VIAKLRPLETRDRLASALKQNRDLGVRILRDLPPFKLIVASDILTGMTSVLLLEAVILGRMAISLQPGRRRPDEFVDHHRGLIERADDLRRLELPLTNALKERDSVWRKRRLLVQARAFDGRAGRLVGELIHKKLGIDVRTKQRSDSCPTDANP
jgi:hypothetical protein